MSSRYDPTRGAALPNEDLLRLEQALAGDGSAAANVTLMLVLDAQAVTGAQRGHAIGHLLDYVLEVVQGHIRGVVAPASTSEPDWSRVSGIVDEWRRQVGV